MPRMRWLLASPLFSLLFSHGVHASQLDVFVAVKCTRTRVEVTFERSMEDTFDKPAVKVPNRWNTEELRSLAEADNEDHFVVTERPKTAVCRIAGVNVRVVVTPAFAPGWRPTGYCATRTGATVAIYRSGRLLLKDGLDACTEEGDVPVSIGVAPSGRPVVVRMSAEEFIEGA